MTLRLSAAGRLRAVAFYAAPIVFEIGKRPEVHFMFAAHVRSQLLKPRLRLEVATLFSCSMCYPARLNSASITSSEPGSLPCGCCSPVPAADGCADAEAVSP